MLASALRIYRAVSRPPDRALEYPRKNYALMYLRIIIRKIDEARNLQLPERSRNLQAVMRMINEPRNLQRTGVVVLIRPPIIRMMDDRRASKLPLCRSTAAVEKPSLPA